MGHNSIRGHSWLLYTDHKNLGARELVSLAANATASGKAIRWYHAIADCLQTGVRVYLKDESNKIADALSRVSKDEMSAVDDHATTLPRVQKLIEFGLEKTQQQTR